MTTPKIASLIEGIFRLQIFDTDIYIINMDHPKFLRDLDSVELALVSGGYPLARHYVNVMSAEQFKIAKTGAGSGNHGGFKVYAPKPVYVGSKSKGRDADSNLSSAAGGGSSSGDHGGIIL